MKIISKQDPWINTSKGKAISDAEMVKYFENIVEL